MENQRKNTKSWRTKNFLLLAVIASFFLLYQNCGGNFKATLTSDQATKSQTDAASGNSGGDSGPSQQPPDSSGGLPNPTPNPIPSPIPAPTPSPTTTTTMPSSSQNSSGFMIGQHFHNDVGSVFHKYMFARTHDNTAVSEGKMKWWIGNDSYDFSALDAFRDFHKNNGAKVLLTFYGSPQWASARPNESNNRYPAWVGGLAEPKDLNSFGRMVQATVSRYKNDLYAVECWNEPFADSYNGYDPGNAEFFSGTPTALADMCKVLYNSTKAVSPNTLVICPAEAYSSPIVVNSKTSQGESILKYCDMIGWHPYGHTGVAGVGGDLAAYVDRINEWTSAAGFHGKPIAITEWGVAYYGNVQSQYQNMSSTQKANVLYQTLKVAYQKGVKAFATYSYDDDFVGINGTDSVTASGITKAVNEFGGK